MLRAIAGARGGFELARLGERGRVVPVRKELVVALHIGLEIGLRLGRGWRPGQQQEEP